jgi:hypothetical protein
MSFRKFPLLEPTATPLLHSPLLGLICFVLLLSWSRNAADEYDVSVFPPDGDDPGRELGERWWLGVSNGMGFWNCLVVECMKCGGTGDVGRGPIIEGLILS